MFKKLLTTHYELQTEKGVTIVEIVIATAVLGIIFATLGGTLMYGIRNSEFGGKRERATLLANEGLEAMRNIRDEDFANLVDNTYGLSVSGNQWTFSGSQDISDGFTRETSVSSIDSNTKEVTTTVTWDELSTRPGSVSLTTRFCNWGFEVTPQGCDWSGGITLLSSLDLSGGQHGLKIQIEGDYGYLVRNGGDPDFVIINLSNISSPFVEGSLDLSGTPQNLAVSDSYAYIASADNNQELQVVDISNPAIPSIVGTYDAERNSNANGIYLVGSTVYLVKDSSNRDELFIIDVTNPALPNLLGSLDLGANGEEIVVLGDYAYIASNDNNEELKVVNISDPNNLSINGSYDLSGNDDALSITGFDNYVLLGRDKGGLHIFNISDSSNPDELGWYDTGDSVNDIALGNENNYAILGTDNNSAELQIIDISDTANPSLITSYDASGDLNGVAYDHEKCGVFSAAGANEAEFMIFNPQ